MMVTYPHVRCLRSLSLPLYAFSVPGISFLLCLPSLSDFFPGTIFLRDHRWIADQFNKIQQRSWCCTRKPGPWYCRPLWHMFYHLSRFTHIFYSLQYCRLRHIVHERKLMFTYVRFPNVPVPLKDPFTWRLFSLCRFRPSTGSRRIRGGGDVEATYLLLFIGSLLTRHPRNPAIRKAQYASITVTSTGQWRTPLGALGDATTLVVPSSCSYYARGCPYNSTSITHGRRHQHPVPPLMPA